MIPFYLITGFLGSGKTTFLKKILKRYGTQKRIAIIQNEFAPSGVDSKELKSEFVDFNLIEINNGSVFCVCQLNNFIQSLVQLVNTYDPEVIFLEASGLADPINIIELLQDDLICRQISLAQIITIVDVVNYFKGLNKITRFKHQIMISDKLIINKTDISTDNIPAIKENINQLNPFTQLELSSYCEVKFDLNYSDHTSAKRLIGIKSDGTPNIRASVLRTHDKISYEQLHQLLQLLVKTAVRIKGYLHLSDDHIAFIQTVFKDISIKIADNYTGPGEIIVFSEDISPVKLRQIYREYSIVKY